MIGLLRDSPGERFDFQPFALPELNEDLLDEVRGLGDQPLLQGYQTVFFHQKRAYRAGAQGPVDFNRNGVATDQGFHQDLNRDFRREILVATPNEWSVLEYRGGAIGQSGDLELLGRKLRSRQETCEEPSLKELLLEAPER
jgi:hypothetical protein